MEKETFNAFRAFVYEKSGITLSSKKEALVSARVAKRMRVLGMATHADYLDRVLNDSTGEELVHLLDAISTNVTSFFRESEHFDFMAEALAGWRAEGQTRFRLWSAACSTGEEPYTMAMTMAETFGFGRVDAKILATDISTRVLDKCLDGDYDAEKVSSIPPKLAARYMDQYRNGAQTRYRVKEQLKRLVVFRRLNLSEPPFPMQGPLDIVFCRNVMIYFDNSVRKRLLEDIYRLLRPGGYLMVGHAESLTGMVSSFKVVRPSVYVKG